MDLAQVFKISEPLDNGEKVAARRFVMNESTIIRLDKIE